MSSDKESDHSGNEAPSTSKRKAELDEIEVDVSAPEPPSKRARRALKKGKPLPPKPNSDDENDGEAKGDRKDKKEQKRSEHGVWIGNLPFTLSAPDLKRWLVTSSGGSITDESITRIKLPTVKDPGRDKKEKPANKGFAYVDFSDVSGKVAAIALSESDLGARRLLIKDASSFEGRPKKEKEPVNGASNGAGDAQDGAAASTADAKWEVNASRKIFVGNMSFKTTEDDVWRNFEKCGEIEWVKVATFEDTGKCKGYGWIMFKEPEAAAWAVKGFVKIKEQVEAEADFQSGSDDEDEKPEDGGASQKQFKTRKWWVNRMLGRELKLELAEDDRMRYKKRFGKDANKQQTNGEERKRPDGNKGRRPRRDESGGGGDDDGETRRKRSADEPLKEASDIAVARLTGAVVKPTGTKVTFD